MNWGKWIIVAFVLFVAFMGILVYRSLNQEFHLVAEDYYEQEIAYQERIDEMENALELDELPAVEYQRSNGIAVLRFPESILSDPIKGKINFYRPSDATLDVVIEIDLDENGVQYIDLKPLKAGNWKVGLAWTSSDTDYYHEIRLFK